MGVILLGRNETIEITCHSSLKYRALITIAVLLIVEYLP